MNECLSAARFVSGSTPYLGATRPFVEGQSVLCFGSSSVHVLKKRHKNLHAINDLTNWEVPIGVSHQRAFLDKSGCIPMLEDHQLE